MPCLYTFIRLFLNYFSVSAGKLLFFSKEMFPDDELSKLLSEGCVKSIVQRTFTVSGYRRDCKVFCLFSELLKSIQRTSDCRLLVYHRIQASTLKLVRGHAPQLSSQSVIAKCIILLLLFGSTHQEHIV